MKTTILALILTYTDDQHLRPLERPMKSLESYLELLKDARNEAGECYNDMRIPLYSK
jgi:hypothetical protein